MAFGPIYEANWNSTVNLILILCQHLLLLLLFFRFFSNAKRIFTAV